MRIVLPEHIDILPKKYIEELGKLGEVKVFNDFPKTEAEIAKRIQDAQIVVVKWIRPSEKLLEKAPQLECIVVLSSGYADLPLKEARTKGITILNCPKHNTLAVAEHAIALLFALIRHVVEAQLNIQGGQWRKSPYSYLGREVTGKRIGIIGYGNIGKKVAKLAKGLGMKVVYVNSQSSPQELDDLIKTSDFITLNLSYSKSAYHIINESRLKQMKKTAFLINTARGAIVDTKALEKALRAGEIAGAALDVVEGELTVGDAPSELVKLSKLPNVVITPHIAYNTKEAAERLGREMVENVKAYIEGNPVNVVN